MLIKKVIIPKKIFKIKFFPIIICFIMSNFLTMVAQIKNNFVVNFAYLFYAIMVFFIFYGMHSCSSKEEIHKEIIIIFKLIIIISTILALLSVLTLFLPVGNLSKDINHRIGIYYDDRGERLTGIYGNPNFLGFCSACSIMMSFSAFKKSDTYGTKKRILPLWFIIFSVIINFTGLLLCDSNASFLFLIIYTIVLIFCKVFSSIKVFNMVKILKGAMIFFIVCLVIIVSYFGVRYAFQNFISNTVNDAFNSGSVDNHIVEEEASPQDITIGRRPGSSRYTSIDGGRVELIKQGLKIFLHHPIVGIGRGNLVYYGKVYFENGIKFSDLHNGYLTILVSSGIVGFLFFVIFGLGVAHKLFSFLFESVSSGMNYMYCNIISMISGYCVYSLFEKTILTEITYMTLFFWAMLGYAMSYVYQEN